MRRSAIFYSSLLMLLLPALFVSCSGKGDNSQIADSVEDTLKNHEAAASDSVQIEQEKRALEFANSQQARDFMARSGNLDKYEQGIISRLVDENLEYATKLLNNEYKYFLIVDKQIMKVILYDKFGRSVKEYGMCCARNYGTKHKRSDCRTPEGFFSIEGIYDSTDWLYTDDNGVTYPGKGVFGKRFMRLDTPVTRAVGIHGTNSPGSIGRRSSHGCIRLKNDDIMDLVKYCEKGMPVIVSPSARDMAVNKSEGYYIPAVHTDGKAYEIPELPAKKEEAKKAATDSTSVKTESAPKHDETPEAEKEQQVKEPVESTAEPQ